MKLVAILMLAAFLQVSAKGYSQERISLDYSNINIKKLLSLVSKKSDYTFLYRNVTIPDKNVSIRVKDVHVLRILDETLAGTDLSYKELGGKLIVIIPAGDKINARTITGKVTDADGQPLIGVTVIVKGTTKGAQTDANGDYSLEVPENAVLVFSYIGHESQEVPLKGNAARQDIVMKAGASGLSEVIVVGYGTQRRINLSGAVDAISGKALQNRPITNVSTGLQGLLPNLNIGVSNGRISSAPSLNIRGFTSIGNLNSSNQQVDVDPFILIDNVPATKEELSRLNPADIEGVTLLKDAASAAIYGARAAYGVLLITTKTGYSKRVSISVNSNYALRTLGRVPEITTDPYTVMDFKHRAATPLYNLYPDAVREYAKKRSADPSLPAVIVDPTNPNAWAYYGTTNWLEEAYRQTAPSSNTNFSISQKTDKLAFYVSGEYYRYDGQLKYGNDIYNRYNLRAKATYDVNDRLKFGVNTVFTSSDYNAPVFLDGNFFHNLNRTPSLSVPRNPDGTWTSDGAALFGALQEGGRTKSYLNEYQATLNGELAIIKGIWDLKGDMTFRRGSGNGKSYDISIPYRTGPNQPFAYAGSNPSYGRNTSDATRYNVYNVYTDFHRTFAKKHFVQALAGFNQEYRNYSTNTTTRQNLISSSLPDPLLTTGTLSQTGRVEDYAVRGLFYRLNYIYNDKYIVEFNGRYDGTSRFPDGDRWGFFPSASAAWVVTGEEFFKPIASSIKLDVLKFRASYGALGNQVTTSYYPYIPTMPTGQIGQILDGTRPIGVKQPGAVSPTLTWEKVQTMNYGVSMAWLNNRLSLDADIYTRRTKDMLVKSKTLPAVFGTGEPQENAADLKVKGWELSLKWSDAVQVGGSPLNYGVRFILADSRAYITKYDNPAGLLSDYYVGREIGEIWGLVNDGFFQSEDELRNWPDQSGVGSDDQGYKFYVGDLKFKDLNGDKKVNYGKNTVSDPGDRVIIGNSAIRLPYSVMLNADWKGIDASVFFQGVGKRDWYPNASNHYFWGVFAQPWTNVQTHNLDSWTPEHPDAYFPRVKAYIAEDASELGAPQTKYLQNAAYLRLKNVTVGYTLPSSFTRKAHIERLRIYFGAENIFTRSHLKARIDPEGLGGSVYPFQQTYSGGINLNF
ncbi:SusC/RagA family TonB-linked outer membrane protein [Chitinophaga barathri]|nr:SusC/RagA family TonB-linked outer membrane protein [Chitinophaga barathri]